MMSSTDVHEILQPCSCNAPECYCEAQHDGDQVHQKCCIVTVVPVNKLRYIKVLAEWPIVWVKAVGVDRVGEVISQLRGHQPIDAPCEWVQVVIPRPIVWDALRSMPRKESEFKLSLAADSLSSSLPRNDTIYCATHKEQCCRGSSQNRHVNIPVQSSAGAPALE